MYVCTCWTGQPLKLRSVLVCFFCLSSPPSRRVGFCRLPPPPLRRLTVRMYIPYGPRWRSWIAVGFQHTPIVLVHPVSCLTHDDRMEDLDDMAWWSCGMVDSAGAVARPTRRRNDKKSKERKKERKSLCHRADAQAQDVAPQGSQEEKKKAVMYVL